MNDRNLLFGILALQMDFISREALVDAMHHWVRDKRKPIGEILVAERNLAGEVRSLLESMVDQHVKVHEGRVENSLASLSTAEDVENLLASLNDTDISASLGRLPRTSKESHPDEQETQTVEVSGSHERFRILRPHAAGGLGQVFVAQDMELNRKVALKEIQERHARNEQSKLRFLLEAEVTGALEHPGIVPVYGLGSHADGRPYYAMRFIKGDSLKTAIERFHGTDWSGKESALTLELRNLLGRFVDVCNAVAYAHSKGVLHRDLKPGNIMLGNYGETLVVDWGLAKVVGKQDDQITEESLVSASGSGETPTQAGTALGTPQYMSPEQAGGKLTQLGPATDVYSLGATLYHLLTGRPAFEQNSVGEVLQQVLDGRFPPPRSVAPRTPMPLEAVCLKAMATRPTDRYASPGDLARDVEAYLADEPVTAFREPLSARMARFGRRHRSAMQAGVAAAVLIAAVSVSAAVLINEQRRAAEMLAEERDQTIQQRDQAARDRLTAQVDSLRHANPSSVHVILESLAPVREQVLSRLEKLYSEVTSDSERTRLALALLPVDRTKLDYLKSQVLKATPQEHSMIVRELMHCRDDVEDELWRVAADVDADQQQRFRAACALAQFAPTDQRWESIRDDVAGNLVEQPPLLVPAWFDALTKVRAGLKEPLIDLFQSNIRPESRHLIASLLAESFTSGSSEFVQLLCKAADPKQFEALFPAAEQFSDDVVGQLRSVLEERPRVQPSALPGGLRDPDRNTVERVERTFGLLTNEFALAQAIPVDQVESFTDELRDSGYRPIRCRVYDVLDRTQCAIVWSRDDLEWKLALNVSKKEARKRIDEWAKEGFQCCDVCGWAEAGEPAGRFAVLGVKDERRSKVLLGETITDFIRWQQTVSTSTGVYDLRSLHAFVDGSNDPRFSAVLQRTGSTQTWFYLPMVPELQLETRLTPSHQTVDVCLFSPKPPARTSSYVTDPEKLIGNVPDANRELMLAQAKPWTDGARLVVEKNYDEAIQTLTRAIQTQSPYSTGYGFRAIAYARMGQRAQALQDLAEMRRITNQTLSPNQTYQQRLIALQAVAYVEAVVRALGGESAEILQQLDELFQLSELDYAGLFFAARAAATIADVCEQDGQDQLAKQASRRAVELIRQALEAGWPNDNWQLEADWELDVLRDREDFQSLLKDYVLERRYCAVWRNAPSLVETQTLHGLSAGEHLARCRTLAAKGYRPTAVTVGAKPGSSDRVCGSIWERPLVSPATVVESAQRRANAVIALLRLGSEADVWSGLAAGDPTFLDEVMGRAPDFEIDPDVVVNRLKMEPNPKLRSLLILMLGFYDWNRLENGDPIAEEVVRLFRDDASSGVHSAAQWTLTRWNQRERLTTNDLVATEPVGGRDWYINAYGHTMACFDGPIEFWMGSPASERERNPTIDPTNPGNGFEALHPKEIPRSFALATHETTTSQYLQYRKDFTFSTDASPASDSPIVEVDWYDAVKYCRWLSEKEGVPREQMCYPAIEQIGPQMELPRDFLQRTGYRLPTESEWEYACRAGARSKFSFGENDRVLNQYAWWQGNANDVAKPVGEHLPNAWGLFDMHGNVGEWCVDVFQAYRLMPGGVATPDIPVLSVIDSKVVRSGAYTSTNPAGVRCAQRDPVQVTTKDKGIGFRIARTLP